MANLSTLEALGHPTRRKLFEALRAGPRSVGELVQAAGGLTQPAVSQHLQVLKAARLVRVRPDGQRRLYSVDPAGLAELRAYVESFWEPVLRAFQQTADEIAQPHPETAHD
jgi:DNA-binding transcriptional ArsR family regulator